MQRPSAQRFRRPGPARAGTGLARALSKLGYCSRSEGWGLVESGRVRVNGALVRDPERRVDPGSDRIEVDGVRVEAAGRVYLMLNKPRGLVTSAADEKGRETVFQCLASSGLPFVAPVGRLDMASEGLLLFTNDTAWAARLTDPASQVPKTYHVQVDCVAGEPLLRAMSEGVDADGERLRALRVSVLRAGEKNSWIEVVLEEGRNRHIRRMLEALGVEVLRLVRVAIGPLVLGTLPKGQVRRLTEAEVAALAGQQVNPSRKSPGRAGPPGAPSRRDPPPRPPR